jgi:hypothetical protein
MVVDYMLQHVQELLHPQAFPPKALMKKNVSAGLLAPAFEMNTFPFIMFFP